MAWLRLVESSPDAMRGYGAANPPLTISYAGFVNGDTTAALHGTPSLSSRATTISPPGL